MAPGHTSIANTGSGNAGTLNPGTCTQAGSGTANDLCSRMTTVITDDTHHKQVFSGTFHALQERGPIRLPPPTAGARTSFTFAVTLPAVIDNSYQGLSASLPMTWNFSQ